MLKYDLCCLGHVTLDKVITPDETVSMAGGTSFYCTHAIKNFKDINYSLVASLAKEEWHVIEAFKQMEIQVKGIRSEKSLYFENIYGINQNERSQRVLAKADPFTQEAIKDIDAKVYFLGALTADDFSLDFITYLSSKGLIAVDSQGYLREVIDQKVEAIDWENKIDFFKHIHYLKVNEMELEILTGEPDIKKAAVKLYNWGVKEVVITLGDMGSIIYDGNQYYSIPAYVPNKVVDATGCGDTYMAGYLYKRTKGASFENAGKFGAAMATIKIEKMGPFDGTEQDVLDRINNSEIHMPNL